MKKNIAYIDAANLKFGVRFAGWTLDYSHFRSWLRDKFKVEKAILFMGFVEANQILYDELLSYGYEIIFKPTFKNEEGILKGNVDGELILQIAKDYYEGGLNEVVVVSNDGDYHCIVEFLKEKEVTTMLVLPNIERMSSLLKRTNIPRVDLGEFKEKLQVKVKRLPDMP